MNAHQAYSLIPLYTRHSPPNLTFPDNQTTILSVLGSAYQSIYS